MAQDQELTANNNRIKSVIIRASISNEPNEGRKDKLSLYGRLTRYRRDKGIKDSDVIRFAIGMLLDKVGY